MHNLFSSLRLQCFKVKPAHLVLLLPTPSDEQHPLHDNYVFMTSGVRLALPKQHTDRFRKSFVP